MDSRRVVHLAELARLAGIFRPLYALGYITTLKHEFGLDDAHPVPRVEHDTSLTYAESLAEVRCGIEDARQGIKPHLQRTDFPEAA